MGLQKDYTTPEQSKRLLELGVPAWTADLYFYEEGSISNDDEPTGVIPYDEVYKDNSEETMFSSYVELPCWSVGRLIEIYDTCCPNNGDWPNYFKYGNLLEYVIDCIDVAIEKELIDFSKLKE